MLLLLLHPYVVGCDCILVIAFHGIEGGYGRAEKARLSRWQCQYGSHDSSGRDCVQDNFAHQRLPWSKDLQTVNVGPISIQRCSSLSTELHTSGRKCAIVNHPNIGALERDRYEDFQECFTLWCKEEPHGAEGIFNTLSRHMEDQIHVCIANLSFV